MFPEEKKIIETIEANKELSGEEIYNKIHPMIVQAFKPQEWKVILIPELMKNRYLKYMAGSCVRIDERSIYHLAQSIKCLLPHPEVKKALKKRYGEEYTQQMIRFNRQYNKLAKINYIITTMKSHSLKESDKEGYRLYKDGLELMDDINIIDDFMNDIWTYITLKTNLKKYSIKKEDMIPFEKEDQKVEYTFRDDTTQKEAME